jgi:hypothetical protein
MPGSFLNYGLVRFPRHAINTLDPTLGVVASGNYQQRGLIPTGLQRLTVDAALDEIRGGIADASNIHPSGLRSRGPCGRDHSQLGWFPCITIFLVSLLSFSGSSSLSID